MVGERQGNLWIWLLGGIVALAVVGSSIWFFTRPSEDQPATKPNGSQSDDKPNKSLSVSIAGIPSDEPITGILDIDLQVDDINRVTRAEYYIDGDLAHVTYAYPFSYRLDTAKLTEGEHTITAKAYDNSGNAFEAAPVRFTVKHAAEEEAATGTGSSSSSKKKTSQSSQGSSGDEDNGGSNPPASDTTAPSAPGSVMLSADDGYTTNVSWNASTDNVGVNGYQVYRDGAAIGSVLGANTTSYQDQTVVPGNTYEYSVKALDAANNVSAFSNEPQITLVPTSIWIAADSPFGTDTNSDSYELGVKFRPLVDGKVTGVKFYKGAGNTGVHVGNLWESDGTHLADVTFDNETAGGWQQATFDEPVDVTAGTTYVVSYSAPNGHFSYTSTYFADEGITSQYLTAMASGVDGNNGVFHDDPGSFPASSFNNTNYWVDALFMPNENAGGPTAKALDNSTVYPGYPGSNNTGIPVGKRLPTRDRGIQIYETGAIMENIDISGQIDIRADDILIRNSKINGFVYLDTDIPPADTWDFTIRDTEINNGTSSRGGVSLGNFTLERVNIYGGQMSVLCGGNCTVTDSWFHGQYVPADQDWHLGGFLSNGGSDMTIIGNTIVCDTPNNEAGGGCSGNLNLFGDFSPIENVHIEGNLFPASAGATYCVNLGYNAFKPFGPDAQNIDVIDNVFQRGTSGNCASVAVGTDYMIGGVPAPGNSWINNKWDDGTVIPAPL